MSTSRLITVTPPSQQLRLPQPCREPNYSIPKCAIRAHLRLLVEEDDAAYVLLYDFRSLTSEDRAAVLLLRDAYEGLWNGLLHSAAGAGFIKPDADLQLTRHMLLGAINWTAQWYRPDGKLSVDRIADQYVDIFFRGVLP